MELASGPSISAQLLRAGGRLNFDDSSDPEAIRSRFGASKKAFKQALGALFRARKIVFLNPGIQSVADGNATDTHAAAESDHE